jgi:hypothetical protein
MLSFHLYCTWIATNWSLVFAGLGHFDLSFWAFEQLAHPLYGIQMLEYRAVDCDSGAPVPNSFISKTDIYQGGTKAGWNWFPYGDSYSRYAVPGKAHWVFVAHVVQRSTLC